MIYYTGDIHGDPYEVIQFCDSKKLTEQDTLVLLGDVGANYYRNRRDTEMKRVLAAVKPTMLCIHGNHEIRPASIPSYRTKQWNGGTVWVEEAFPRLLFAMDGEIFDLEGLRHLVIGGAYSVDKFYRLARGYGWWPDEQPSQEIKDKVIQTLCSCGWQVDTVLSHTCPYQYEPQEAFLPMIDQSIVVHHTASLSATQHTTMMVQYPGDTASIIRKVTTWPLVRVPYSCFQYRNF